MIELEPLRQKHFHELAKQTCPYPFAGLAATKAGELVGCGGVYFQENEWVAFAFQKEGLRATKTMLREARRLVASTFQIGAKRILASSDPKVPRSAEFLERLGFAPLGVDVKGNPGWELVRPW